MPICPFQRVRTLAARALSISHLPAGRYCFHACFTVEKLRLKDVTPGPPRTSDGQIVLLCSVPLQDPVWIMQVPRDPVPILRVIIYNLAGEWTGLSTLSSALGFQEPACDMGSRGPSSLLKTMNAYTLCHQ